MAKKIYAGLMNTEELKAHIEEQSRVIKWDIGKHPRFDCGICEKMHLKPLGQGKYALKGFKLKEGVGPVGFCEALDLVTAGRVGCPHFERRGASRRRRVVLRT